VLDAGVELEEDRLVDHTPEGHSSRGEEGDVDHEGKDAMIVVSQRI
jgi:hypothetical protein